MPKITFIEADGTEIVVDARSGISLMENAIANNVDGIEAECGGSCMCATCHCYLAEDQAGIAAMEDDEDEMLGFVASERQSGSRLSCQITVTDETDGMQVRLPAEQN
jgi:2Fe-2S ferredoxin